MRLPPNGWRKASCHSLPDADDSDRSEFKAGWWNYWHSVGGRRGFLHWLGFVAAALTSTALYTTLKFFLWE